MAVVKSNKRKYTKKKDEPEKANITLDNFILDTFCKFALTGSSYVRITQLIGLRNFLNQVDPRTYQSDIEKSNKIQFIKTALNARIDFNLTDKGMIWEHVITHIPFEPNFIDPNVELTKDEVKWVNNVISENLKYSFVYKNVDELLDLCAQIKSTDYRNRGDLIDLFENKIDYIKNEFRKSKLDDSLTDMTFSLRDGQFENAITETYNLITNPSRRLITGMQGLNQMVGGGFESGRVYMLMGISGIGKSLSLLNIIYQLKRYNLNYKTKDPTKTPCIVLLTMENTVVETVQRLYDMALPQDQGLENCPTPEDAIYKLRTSGELVLNDESPIDIVFRYKANKSVDTSYLYSLCDNLEDDGYEVICLVQDHIKRIRSVYSSYNSDIRLELGDIVNEFKVFAAAKDIPVITDTHLNRDAAKVIEDNNTRKSKVDITMKLGKSNVGESLLMIDNLDCGIIINLDYDEEQNKFMVFDLIKMRGKSLNGMKYFAQPFVYNSIRMVEDVYGPPQYRTYLHKAGNVHKINNVIRPSSSNSLYENNEDVMAGGDTFAQSNNVNLYQPYPDEELEAFQNEFEPAVVKAKQPVINVKIRTPIYFENEEKNKFDHNSIENFKNTLRQNA